MFQGVGRRAFHQLAGIDRSVRGHEEILRKYVFAAGALHAEHVPGVVHDDLFAGHHHVHAGAAALRVSASEDYPLRAIDTTAKLPAPVDPITALRRARLALPGQGARD